MKAIEQMLEDWAAWALSGRHLPQGYPAQSWSPFATERIAGKDSGLRTASGVETRTFKPMDPPDAWGPNHRVEDAVQGLRRAHPRLHEAICARYMGYVPKRYENIAADENGVRVCRMERTRRREDEPREVYIGRLATRWGMARTTLYNRLDKAHLYLEGVLVKEAA